MRRGGPQWIWIALIGIALVAGVIVLLALANGGGEAKEAAETEAETVVVTETEGGGGEDGGAGETTEAPTSAVVPDVRRMMLPAAGERAADAGLIADSYPVEDAAAAGTVVAQNPAPGTDVAPTRRLRLDVSVGPEPRETVRVPDVTGPKAPRARQIAWERGFTTLTADRDAPTAEEVDEVILQEPAAGTQAPAFTQITLYVGR